MVIPVARVRPRKRHLAVPTDDSPSLLACWLVSLLGASVLTLQTCVSPAQISSHVKAIDAIYQGTDFMGIRNISFMVKRIRVSLVSLFCSVFFFSLRVKPAGRERLTLCVLTGAPLLQINTTTDEKDRSNPFRFPNIGVEKFLELNSEQNHDDYCLAYVFTDRDFDDGVLGLAWVGAPSGSPRQSDARELQRSPTNPCKPSRLCNAVFSIRSRHFFFFKQRRADASDCSNPKKFRARSKE